MSNLKTRIESAISHFEKELNSLRTSRASPSMLDNILIDAYGSKTPLNQLGNISIPDANTLTLQVWDMSLVKIIENTIIESILGITTNRWPDNTLTSSKIKKKEERSYKNCFRICRECKSFNKKYKKGIYRIK